MSNVFTRIPSWLYSALGLSEPQVPNLLDTNAVLPTVDIFGGGGAGLATWRVSSLTGRAASSSGADVDEIEADPNHVRLVWLTLIHTGGAGAGTVAVRLLDGVNPTALVLANISIGADSSAAHTDIHGERPILLPPGFKMQMEYPATGLGESYSGRKLIGATRAGFKFW